MSEDPVNEEPVGEDSGDGDPGKTDDIRMAEIATALADGLEAHLRQWLRALLDERSGGGVDPLAAERAIEAAVVPMLERVRVLLRTDIDEQRANPLAMVRSGLGPVTDLLASLGVPEVERDPFVVRAFPDDVYDLAPATFGDIHESLQEAGLMWGAAKAHVHLSRRRAEGLR